MGENFAPTKAASSALGTITRHLSRIPKRQLPIAALQCITDLEACKHLLSTAKNAGAKDFADGVHVHKYITQISSLLNGTAPEERWAAVVLIKATVEYGGYEMLKNTRSWLRGLLAILEKSGASTTKTLCIVTITRIFLLTNGIPTLSREITTPSLPSFIKSCLNVIDSQQPGILNTQRILLQTVLESFCQLLPQHPNLYRSFRSHIYRLCLSLTSATTPEIKHTPACIEAARTLSVLLSHCEPKQTGNEQWAKSFSSDISQAQEAANKIFQAAGELWEALPSLVSTDLMTDSQIGPECDSLNRETPLILYDPQAPFEKLCLKLKDIKKQLSTSTSTPITFPIALTSTFLLKMLVVVVPSQDEGHVLRQKDLAYNVSREDQQALWSQLPEIHAAAIDVLQAILSRFGSSCKPIMLQILDYVEWVFRHEKFSSSVRAATYRMITSIVTDSGTNISKDVVEKLDDIVLSCCVDLCGPENLISRDYVQYFNANRSPARQSASEDISFGLEPAIAPSFPPLQSPSDAQVAARDLLPIFLDSITAQHVPQKTRSIMDRTVILAEHHHGIWASALNPLAEHVSRKARSSLLPYMARAMPLSKEIEGMIRPRMPVIQLRRQANENGNFQGIESSNELQDNMTDVENSEPEQFSELIPNPAAESPLLGNAQDLWASPLAKSENEESTGSQPQMQSTARHRGSKSDNSLEARVPRKRAVEHTEPSHSSCKRVQVESLQEKIGTAAQRASEHPEPSCEHEPILHTSGTRAVERYNQADEGSSDDEEFEIPPLTMDPETEEEEATEE